MVRHYRARAESFYHAAQDLDVLDSEGHAPAIGLLSVHGCIALADAVLVASSGDRLRNENHAEAVRQLRAWCSAKRIADGGIKHFEWLVRKKTHFSYDDKFVDMQDLQAAKDKMGAVFQVGLQRVPGIRTILGEVACQTESSFAPAIQWRAA